MLVFMNLYNKHAHTVQSAQLLSFLMSTHRGWLSLTALRMSLLSQRPEATAIFFDTFSHVCGQIQTCLLENISIYFLKVFKKCVNSVPSTNKSAGTLFRCVAPGLQHCCLQTFMFGKLSGELCESKSIMDSKWGFCSLNYCVAVNVFTSSTVWPIAWKRTIKTVQIDLNVTVEQMLSDFCLLYDIRGGLLKIRAVEGSSWRMLKFLFMDPLYFYWS